MMVATTTMMTTIVIALVKDLMKVSATTLAKDPATAPMVALVTTPEESLADVTQRL